MSIKKNIRLLTWFNFFTDFRLYAPIAIIYYARITQSYTLAASIFSITFIVSSILDVPTGLFADRIGRKKTMISGATTAVIYALLYAIGTNFWILALGAFFEGLSRAFYSGNNNALLHNMLSEEGMEHEYHTYSGKLNAMFQIALGVSGVIGAFLASWSFPLIMWLSVIPQLACLFISFQISDRKHSNNQSSTVLQDLKQGVKEFIHNKNLRLLSITSVWNFAAGETSYQFQAAFYNTVLPVWAIGIAKTLSNVGATIGFYFAGKFIDRFGSFRSLLIGEIYSQASNFIALIFPTSVSPFLMSTNSFFYGTSSTAEGSLMQKEFTDAQRATMSSLNSFAGSFMFGIFAFLVGFFADKAGPRNALLILAVSSLPIIWLRWKLLRTNKN